MMRITLAEVAGIVGGRLVDAEDGGARHVTGPVVVDSRAVTPGGLFGCVRGEHADGHQYAAAAVAAGAVGVLAEREVGVPAVVVADVVQALGVLAAAVLQRADVRIVGVTGSVGKTSTKDMLRDVFSAFGPTVAPANSFNNEVGLPLTVLRVDAATRTLVCEYSARGIGHIRYLTGIARPDIAVVLNVGVAHLGEFGSPEAIATAKGELVEALPAQGVAVLNADDTRVLGMRERTEAAVMTFGFAAGADVRISDLRVDGMARPTFRLTTTAGVIELTLPVHGAHQAGNAAAAVAAALAAGHDLGTAAAALERGGERSAHRMSMQTRADGLVVIDDAYNANPESVRAAIDAMAALEGRARRWAVLGEMRELGADAPALHRSVGEYAARNGVDEVVAIAADAIAAGAEAVPGWGGRARRVGDAAGATELLLAETGPGDAVLVKASNTVRLWRVAEALLGAQPVGGR
jgi:UDP-N-acetylmuramoyl-tripeptide--D-alanyl-D-alanine ligase